MLLPTPVARDAKGVPADGYAGASLPREISLLPTPRASDGTHGGPNQRGSKGDLALPSAVALLPTPRATAGGSATETMALLPTPTAARSGRNKSASAGAAIRPSLDTLGADPDRWGKYAPAIARWEAVLGRPAPKPTESASRRGRRLSARFVEWMMGCPDGWVTDVPGVTRSEAVRMLGNGVVQQQATAALQWLAHAAQEIA